MSRNENMQFIRLIEDSSPRILVALAKCNVARSRYYRWRQKLKTTGTKNLEDNRPHRARTWNQSLPEQVGKVLEYATFYPELSCREISLYTTDNEGFT